jgi:hypothetical protein
LLAEFLEDSFGLHKLAVPQAGLGYLGPEPVFVFIFGHGKGAVVLEQGGHPIAPHGQAITMVFQFDRVGRFQIGLFRFLESCLALGHELFGFALVQAPHHGSAGGGPFGGAAGGNEHEHDQA